MRDYQNIYQAAREGAGLTQEAAAELLDCSTKSVQCYESGATTPSPDMVRRMMSAYSAPWLGNHYCNGCPLGAQRNLPAEDTDLQQLAIELALAFGSPEQFQSDARRMLEISADRQIRDDEITDYNAIMGRLWMAGLLAEKARIVLERQGRKSK